MDPAGGEVRLSGCDTAEHDEWHQHGQEEGGARGRLPKTTTPRAQDRSRTKALAAGPRQAGEGLHMPRWPRPTPSASHAQPLGAGASSQQQGQQGRNPRTGTAGRQLLSLWPGSCPQIPNWLRLPSWSCVHDSGVASFPTYAWRMTSERCRSVGTKQHVAAARRHDAEGQESQQPSSESRLPVRLRTHRAGIVGRSFVGVVTTSVSG
jgi:hypothetical protein